MPCDIGYKDISRIRVKPPNPTQFKEKTKPKIDKGLMDNLGISDSVFIEWLSELETNPLLELALKRALAACGNTGKVEFKIKNGELVASSEYLTTSEKRAISEISKRVSERFQIELIGIIFSLLDYDTQITQITNTLTIEAEKNERANVHKYAKVSIGNNGEGVLAFEHFESENSLKEERAKFLALAEKFGVKINITEEKKSGQPIPQDVEHQHFLKSRG